MFKAYATRDIPVGEEISDCYSETFARQSLEERREVHRRYHFECRCQACVEDWPTFPGLPMAIHSKELKKKIKCLNNNLSRVKDAVSLARKVLPSPHSVHAQLEEKLHSLLNTAQ